MVRKIQEAELLIEAGHEDRKKGAMTLQQQLLHSQWVYAVFMIGCPAEAIEAVQEYEAYIISEGQHDPHLSR